jgi:hypothetical protein
MPFTLKKGPSRNLCTRCRYGQVTELRSGRVRSFCTVGSESLELNDEVLSCTSYRFDYEFATHEMHGLAWILKVDNRGLSMGFRPPKKNEKDE